MRILLGVQYYEHAWAYGGPPRMVYDLARQLASRGHEVTVCTTDALDARRRLPAGEELKDGVRVVRFRNLSNMLAWRLKVFLPLGMRRWLRDNVGRFDVIHLFEARTVENAWAAEAALAADVPFVWSVWGSLPIGEGWRAVLKHRYDRGSGSTLIHRARALLAQNRHESALYAEHGGDPARVVLWPLGVDADDYASPPPRGSLRRELSIPDDAAVVLFVGRIHELKGLAPLIRAFARVTVRDARLVIVGRDDGFLDAAVKLVHALSLDGRVHFPGPRYGADAIAAYVDCDVFSITPTHFEETSLASLAACACGRPVVINDRCDIPWLDEYDAGICVAHDEGAIASALDALLSDKARRCKMGDNARRMVQERFFASRVVEQIERVYQEAASR